MSRTVNVWHGLGNVGKDPEIKTSQGGMTIATFSVATTSSHKDAQGNWQEETEWTNCTAFKRTAEIVRDYVHKGSKVFVKGPLQTQSWEDKKTGEKKYRTGVIVNELVLLSGKDEGNKASYSSTTKTEPQPEEIQDDDIPFN